MISVHAGIIAELTEQDDNGHAAHWTPLYDLQGFRWDLTDCEYDGDRVLMPRGAGNYPWPALRRDVEALHGPLRKVEENEA